MQARWNEVLPPRIANQPATRNTKLEPLSIALIAGCISSQGRPARTMYPTSGIATITIANTSHAHGLPKNGRVWRSATAIEHQRGEHDRQVDDRQEEEALGPLRPGAARQPGGDGGEEHR